MPVSPGEWCRSGSRATPMWLRLLPYNMWFTRKHSGPAQYLLRTCYLGKAAAAFALRMAMVNMECQQRKTAAAAVAAAVAATVAAAVAAAVTAVAAVVGGLRGWQQALLSAP